MRTAGKKYCFTSRHKYHCNAHTYYVYRKSLRLQFVTLTVLLLVLIFSSQSFAIKFTNIKHLYDISHDMNEPSDVAVSKSGQIYIVDGVNNRVIISDNNGNVLFTFGTKGSNNGQMLYPLGIHVDSAGDIYLADSGNHRVQIFGPDGTYKSQINIPPHEGITSDPTDITVDESTRRLFIVDNNNHHVLVYDLSTFTHLDTYGTPGMDKREFRYPFLISSDTNGYLYIVDVINTRVQVLTPQGKFVQFVGGWGVEKGEFFRPKGVAVDSRNKIYVSDGYMGVIQVFNTTGEFESVLSIDGTSHIKKFNTPVGIHIDNNDRLYVVEMFANRVGVYSIHNEK